MWREAFDLFGPLDWRRQDFLAAKANQYQSLESKPLKDFLLFGDPTAKELEQTEEDVFRMFGD